VLLLLVWLNLNLSHERPLGYEQTTITTAILVAGLPSIILTAWLGSHRRRLRAWMWAGFSAIFYLAETQIVYPFSKYGPAADLYTLLLFASVIFAIVAMAAASPRLFARLTRSPP
jgi:peptidoglycan/LPS O-acetylase OafA/YrhL